MEIDPKEVRGWSEKLGSASLEEILAWGWERFGKRAAIGTSFQGAGIVLMHRAREMGFDFPVFTLDTGLLFPETLDLWRKLEDRLGIEIEAVRPEHTVEEQARREEPDLWKTRPDTCCVLRKVLPLQRKLGGLDAWITGLRRQQSETRQKAGVLEVYKFDVLRDRHIVKMNPLAGWSREAVRDYLLAHDLPVNVLQERGYRSIGCMPCTRPVVDGESERAGRWTGFDKAECGIHTFLGENI